MHDISDQHDAALATALHAIINQSNAESDQWKLLESLCFAVGKLHGRPPIATSIFVEMIAERIAAREDE